VKPRWNLAGWPFGIVYWPLERAFGSVVAWNLFVLLGFLGAGGFAAVWIRELGAWAGAAVVGGLAFALAPYMQAQASAGHLLAWIAMLLPLALFALERARRGSRWWLALSGAALASIPLSGQLHLALGAIPFFAAYALARLRWAALLAVPALAAGLFADYVAVRGTTGASGRSFRQVEFYSAHLPDFLSRSQERLEGIVYLGWTVLAAAVVGLGLLLARRRWGLSLVLGGGALVPVLFALGSNLPGYELLWRHMPGLRHTRVPERLLPIACLALAALVAFALSRWQWPGLAAMVVLLLVVDLRLGAFHATPADEHNRAYAALRGEPAGRLLELPVFPAGEQDNSVYLYDRGQSPRAGPAGYSTTAPRKADRLLRMLRAEPCAHLAALGIRYVATHLGRANPCGGQLLARDGPVAVYRVAPQ
jgi:hypothetical protein